MRRMVAKVALCVMAVSLFSGCRMVVDDQDKIDNIVLATVGNEIVTRKEVDTRFTQMRYIYAQYFGQDIAADDKTKLDYMKDTLNQLVDEKIKVHESKQLGLDTLSADDQKSIDEQYNADLASQKDSIRASFEEKKKTDASIDVEAETQKAYDTYLQSNAKQLQDVRKNMEAQVPITKVDEHITKDIVVTDEQVKTEYDKQVSELKDKYKNDATAFPTAAQSAKEADMLYVPAGYVRVQHILIPLDTDKQSEIFTARGTEPTDETNKAADELRATLLKDIEAKANEVLTKAKAKDADFAKLMTEYAAEGDTIMQQEISKAEGIAVIKGSGQVNTYEEAALKLAKDGDISELVPADKGYYIIKRVAVTAEHTRTLDEMKESIHGTLLTKAKEDAITAQMNTWRDELKPVKHENLLNW